MKFLKVILSTLLVFLLAFNFSDDLPTAGKIESAVKETYPTLTLVGDGEVLTKNEVNNPYQYIVSGNWETVTVPNLDVLDVGVHRIEYTATTGDHSITKSLWIQIIENQRSIIVPIKEIKDEKVEVVENSEPTKQAVETENLTQGQPEPSSKPVVVAPTPQPKPVPAPQPKPAPAPAPAPAPQPKPAPAPAPAPVPQPKPAPAPAPAPKPEPVKTTPANHIMFAGSSIPYRFAGQYNPSGVQSIIDSGIVSASVTNFNPSDNQTTYFAGHNPGVMSVYYRNLQIGSIVSVSDSQGNVTNYKMVDVVKTDTSGTVIFSSLGISAGQLYYMGSNTESIAIQYCVNGSADMRVWYGIKV